MRHTKKQVTIDAIQYTGKNRQECVDFIGGEPEGEFIIMASWEKYQAILISTLEGTMRCDAGDWIIKGIKGEFYPCKDDIFRMTYTEADEERADKAANLRSIADKYILGIKWNETNSTLVGVATLYGGFEIVKSLYLGVQQYTQAEAEIIVTNKIIEEIQNHLRFTEMTK